MQMDSYLLLLLLFIGYLKYLHKYGKAKTQAQPVSTLDHFLIDVVAGSQDNFASVKRWQRITPPVQYSHWS